MNDWKFDWEELDIKISGKQKIYISECFKSLGCETYGFQQIADIISSAIYAIGYWCIIDNSTKMYEVYSRQSDTIDETIFHMLANGHDLRLLDVENNKVVYRLNMQKLAKGIIMCQNCTSWNGDIEQVDGLVADDIIQFALFDEITFC